MPVALNWPSATLTTSQPALGPAPYRSRGRGFRGVTSTPETAPETAPEHEYLPEFLAAYQECALWSTSDESDDYGGEPLDANYGSSDFDAGTVASMRADCNAFLTAHSGLIDPAANRSRYGNAAQAGHDFWLSRNGHGAGFFDRGEVYGEANADALQEHARVCGEVYLYVTDAGEVAQA